MVLWAEDLGLMERRAWSSGEFHWWNSREDQAEGGMLLFSLVHATGGLGLRSDGVLRGGCAGGRGVEGVRLGGIESIQIEGLLGVVASIVAAIVVVVIAVVALTLPVAIIVTQAEVGAGVAAVNASPEVVGVEAVAADCAVEVGLAIEAEVDDLVLDVVAEVMAHLRVAVATIVVNLRARALAVAPAFGVEDDVGATGRDAIVVHIEVTEPVALEVVTYVFVAINLAAGEAECRDEQQAHEGDICVQFLHSSHLFSGLMLQR